MEVHGAEIKLPGVLILTQVLKEQWNGKNGKVWKRMLPKKRKKQQSGMHAHTIKTYLNYKLTEY